jgi:ACT domain-containing protein
VKVVITVLGKDRVGIIARVSAVLAENQVNILDISQTILQDYFTMIMLAELDSEHISIPALDDRLNEVGEEMRLQIRVQHEAIFSTMHRV